MTATAAAAVSTPGLSKVEGLKITATQGILAMKGVGKTYRAMDMAEEMLSAGHQIVVMDPTGVWWGLRYLKDGITPAFPNLAVLGGDHGAIALKPNQGKLIAEAVFKQRLSVVLDLSGMDFETEMPGFFADFYSTLGRLNKRRVIHSFIDESDLFAPETKTKFTRASAAAFSHLVRRLRARGFGVTMITQRTQALSKDVISQCERLLVMRLRWQDDIAKVTHWLKLNGYNEREFLPMISALMKGEALEFADDTWQRHSPESVQRLTYDSSRTPEPGEEPPALTQPFDPGALGKWLGAAAEELIKHDPQAQLDRIKELEDKIDELEATLGDEEAAHTETLDLALPPQLEALKAENTRLSNRLLANEQELETANNSRRACVAVLEPLMMRAQADIDAIKPLLDRYAKQAELPYSGRSHMEAAELARETQGVQNVVAVAPSTDTYKPVGIKRLGLDPGIPQGEVMGRAPRKAPKGSEHWTDHQPVDHNLSGLANAICRVLRDWGTTSRRRLAFLVDYAISSKSFQNALGETRSAGYVTESPAAPALTPKGILKVNNAGGFMMKVPRIGAKRRALWKSKLGSWECAIIDALGTEAPNRESLASRIGKAASSKGFQNAVGKLRGLELVSDGWPMQRRPEIA
jgi:hypothetical protein